MVDDLQVHIGAPKQFREHRVGFFIGRKLILLLCCADLSTVRETPLSYFPRSTPIASRSSPRRLLSATSSP